MSVKKDTIFCMFCKKTVPTADFSVHEKSDEHQNIIKVGAVICDLILIFHFHPDSYLRFWFLALKCFST